MLGLAAGSDGRTVDQAGSPPVPGPRKSTRVALQLADPMLNRPLAAFFRQFSALASRCDTTSEQAAKPFTTLGILTIP